VPISIGLHLAALFLILVIPLTAKIVLPMVSVELPDFVRVAPMPPPPPAAARVPPRAALTAAPAPSAPTSAPPTIAPESLDPPQYAIAGPPDLSAGLPPGIGDTIGTSIPPTVLMPPPPQKPAGPVRIADLPVAPHKTVDVRPIYPEFARQAKIEGTVVLEAVLDPTGRVTQLRVIRSIPMLDQAALDAVRQWRYTPSSYGGHPVSVLMTITIRFSLQ
jgi:protein TonB